MVVGNDVVDLTVTRTRREHPGFAARVCSAAELRVIDASRDGSRTLWSFFAAKEAAYKALSKLRSVRFVPRAFNVDAALTCVRHQDQELELRVFVTDEFVHAVAFEGADEPLAGVAQSSEAAASAAVRELARGLASASLNEEPSAFAVVRERAARSWDGYGPPRLLLRGHAVDIDVSLSHHGSYIACALEQRSSREPSVDQLVYGFPFASQE